MAYSIDIFTGSYHMEKITTDDIRELSLYQKAEKISIVGTGMTYRVDSCTLVVSNDRNKIVGLTITGQ